MPVDPMEPPKFRHKKVPRGTGSPPVPIMHSPPRAITVKDQQDWKIPPCISNWKNPKVRARSCAAWHIWAAAHMHRAWRFSPAVFC
jgi:SKIP/SNW domain